ncbi:MAG TPA: thioredoxin [Vicinamibacterales bacterium]|nr:thioredoxin [Vicinamibacterales bacterium]
MADALDDKGVLVACGSCGTRNRLGYASLGKTARCGHCKADIPPPDGPVAATTTAAFDAALRDSALPLVVDFWAPWCGPCRMVAPELEKLARTHRGEWLIVKVNTDEAVELGDRYRIRSIPTMAVMHHGQELARTAGAMPAAQIEAFVRDAIAHAHR